MAQMEFHFIWKGKCSWNISIRISLKAYPPFPDYQWRDLCSCLRNQFGKSREIFPCFPCRLKNGGSVRRKIVGLTEKRNGLMYYIFIKKFTMLKCFVWGTDIKKSQSLIEWLCKLAKTPGAGLWRSGRTGALSPGSRIHSSSGKHCLRDNPFSLAWLIQMDKCTCILGAAT
jgi:hypothetical protein